MRLRVSRLAIPRRLLDLCAEAAEAALPYEEGGILLGSSRGGERIVRYAVGSGPGARRSRTWLEVDHDWQNGRIRELAAAGEDVDFIADWHSHPDAADAAPSRLDVSTLRKMAAFAPLACPDPAMMILFRGARGWRAGAWKLGRDAERRFAIRLVGSVAVPVAITIVDEATPR